MLILSQEYAQKCYIFNTTLTRNNAVAHYPMNVQFPAFLEVPNLVYSNEVERDCASLSRKLTGIYIIYENIGFGRFNFQYHGNKATFEKFLELLNLQKTDELDKKPANCNDDNIKFGLQQVFTIRNIFPVRLIIPKSTSHIAVGKPVISCYYNSPIDRFGKSYTCGEYCPPADKIDESIDDNEEELKSWKLIIAQRYEQRRKNSLLDQAKKTQRNSKAKHKKSTSLRSALRASGLKPETAENPTEKTVEEAAKVQKPKCSKSKHQGNAKTFKRKTKRSGRV